MKREYNTLDIDEGGLDYRAIADIMTIDGKPMGHSTVRNIIVKVMEKFACALMARYGVVGDPEDVAKNPSFQRLIAQHIQEIYANRSIASN